MSAKPNVKRKVIITCAVTGAIHTPSMSPYLPIHPRGPAHPARAPPRGRPDRLENDRPDAGAAPILAAAHA